MPRCSPGCFNDDCAPAPETTKATMHDAFDYHTPTAEQAARLDAVRENAKAFRHVIESLVPAGRERALAMTNLEQALMWAGKGIVAPLQAPKVA